MKILITGAHGFLGRAVVRQIIKTAPGHELYTPNHLTVDFRDSVTVNNYISCRAPDVVIHLAARVGGVFQNAATPGEFFYDNMLMGLNLVEASRRARIRQFITVGTACSYPENPRSFPTLETDLWKGEPARATGAYGVAKLALFRMLQAYREQYGMAFSYLIPTNLYGPGDTSDHVAAEVVRKLCGAKKYSAKYVKFLGWGETTRDFLYVDDCAQAIVRSIGRFHNYPMNLGTGQEVRIAWLAEKVRQLLELDATIEFENTVSGTMHRALDGQRAKNLLGWAPTTSIVDGLKKTIEWQMTRFV